MKNILTILLLASCIFITSCTTNSNNTNNNQDSTQIVKEEISQPAFVPETETYYNIDSAALLISNPISYDVTVKNYKTDDDWEAERLSKTNLKVLVNALFQAVYKGRLTPYDWVSEQPMPIDSVKSWDKHHKRDEIGKIMFTEDWYFSEKTLTMTKKITGITLAYGRINKSIGEISFYPIFYVKLDEVNETAK